MKRGLPLQKPAFEPLATVPFASVPATRSADAAVREESCHMIGLSILFPVALFLSGFGL